MISRYFATSPINPDKAAAPSHYINIAIIHIITWHYKLARYRCVGSVLI